MTCYSCKKDYDSSFICPYSSDDITEGSGNRKICINCDYVKYDNPFDRLPPAKHVEIIREK